MCILYYCVGAAEQCQVPGRPQEADDREAFGSVSSPGAAQRSSPQSSRDLRDHLQDHRAQTPRQGPVPVQVTELTPQGHAGHTRSTRNRISRLNAPTDHSTRTRR